MKLRYGIISCASIAPRFIQAVQSYGDEVIAIASRSLDKATSFQETYHIQHAYGSYQEVYENEDVDIVYIASANHTHYAQAKTALMHKKHVIVEKPFVLTSEEALQLFQYAQDKNCFIMEAQKSVFLPATIRLKEIIDSKELGDLKHIQMSSYFVKPYEATHWMYKKYGGALYGSGTYTIEYLMYLLEDPEIYAQAFGVCAKQGGLLDLTMQLQVNDAILVESSISMRVKTANHAIFYFDKGYVKVPAYWKATCLHYQRYEESQVIEEFPVDFEMIYEISHIHECIEESALRSPIMSAERTIVCAQIVDDLMLSLYQK